MIVAAGMPPAITRLTGSAERVLGAAPKLHCNVAPVVTWIGIDNPSTADLNCSLGYGGAATSQITENQCSLYAL